MRRLTHLIVLAAFVFSCGGQWYVLQGIAWVKMIHDYAQVVPFTEAVSMTLSGKYPCEICKAIADKKQSEQDKLSSIEKVEKKFFQYESATFSRPDSGPAAYAFQPVFLQVRSEPPPTPPPRLILG